MLYQVLVNRVQRKNSYALQQTVKIDFVDSLTVAWSRLGLAA